MILFIFEFFFTLSGIFLLLLKCSYLFKLTTSITSVRRVREVWSSNSRLAKSYTALQTVRHRFNIYANNNGHH